MFVSETKGFAVQPYQRPQVVGKAAPARVTGVAAHRAPSPPALRGRRGRAAHPAPTPPGAAVHGTGKPMGRRGPQGRSAQGGGGAQRPHRRGAPAARGQGKTTSPPAVTVGGSAGSWPRARQTAWAAANFT
ncbi:hypothetical protein GCM10022205_29910 [Spinactinospora alkalitolerans]